MSTEEKKHANHLGFLTSFGNQTDGVIGGLLVLNLAGRPVEFHCTSPVRPNRAQEILYGNTLRGFVCGEQIAPALIARAKVQLEAILTNNPDFLTALQRLTIPLGIVFSHIPTSIVDKERYADWDRKKDGIKNEDFHDAPVNKVSETTRSEFDNVYHEEELFCLGKPTFFYESLDKLPTVPGVDYSLWRETTRGKNRLAFPSSYCVNTTKRSFNELISSLEPFLKFIDSVEPFERIRLAIEEAQKTC